MTDLTAERFFNNQLQKAQTLASANSFLAALEVLEPLQEKFAAKAPLFELLGLIYVNLQLAAKGRDAFERCLELLEAEAIAHPKSDKRSLSLSNIRFNLASTYILTETPLLAYDISQDLDCYAVVEGALSNLTVRDCQQVKQAIAQEAAESIVAIQDQLAEVYQLSASQEQALSYGIALERAYLEIARTQPELARTYLEQASQVLPTAPEPYTVKALTYILEQDIEQALAQFDYILNHLKPGDIVTLNSIIRLLVTQNQPLTKISKYLPTLEEISKSCLTALLAPPPPPLPAEDFLEQADSGAKVREILRLVEAWAFLEVDSWVYQLIQPILDYFQTMQDVLLVLGAEVEVNIWNEALLSGCIAACHLGQHQQALTWLERYASAYLYKETSLKETSLGEADPTQVTGKIELASSSNNSEDDYTEVGVEEIQTVRSLLQRTRTALLQLEAGPLPSTVSNGRFFYYNPNLTYTFSSASQIISLPNLDSLLEKQPKISPQALLQLLVCHLWLLDSENTATHRQVVKTYLNALLGIATVTNLLPEFGSALSISSAVPTQKSMSGLQALQHLVSSHINNDNLHLLALEVLVEQDFVQPDQVVRVWLANKEQVTTFKDL
jgi:hypothetical protein